MNRFNQHPLKNLHHVKKVEQKTGRAAKRAGVGPDTTDTDAFLQSVAIDTETYGVDHASGPDRTAMLIIDSLAMVQPAAESQSDREGLDNLYRRLRELVRVSPPFRPVEIRNAQAIREDGHHRRTAAEQLRIRDTGRAEIRGQEYPDEMTYYVPREMSDALMRRRLEAATLATPRLEVRIDMPSIDVDSVRRAFSGLGASMSSAARGLQALGRVTRDIPRHRSVLNYPIQAQAAEMMRMDFSNLELRALTSMMGEDGGAVTMEEMSRLVAASVAEMGIPAEMFRPVSKKPEPKAAAAPHPDAGKVINRPRRSFAGIMIEEVRNADGSVSRRPRTTDPE